MLAALRPARLRLQWSNMYSTVKANRVQIVLASIALLSAALLAQVLAPRELMARSSAVLSLENVIPKQFGIWTLVPNISPVAPADPEGYIEADASSTR